jgi:hypothetical protein
MRICISLTDATTAELVDRLIDLAPVADLFEIRADLVSDLDMLTILRARTRPLVFTCLPPPRVAAGRTTIPTVACDCSKLSSAALTTSM